MDIKRIFPFIYFSYQYVLYLFIKRILFFKVNKVRLKYLDARSALFQYKEYFFDHDIKVNLDNDDVILDIGSNVGISALYFHKTFPQNQIYAFEPDPAIFKILKTNLKKTNIIVQNVAISSKTGTAKFSSQGNDMGALSDLGTTQVKTIKLSDITKKPIGIMKMDIEGHENELIEEIRLILPQTKILILEHHTLQLEKQKLSKILSLLEKNNFRYYIENAFRRKNIFQKNPETSFDNQVNIYAIKGKFK
jgi:FkbM family methyltransferase